MRRGDLIRAAVLLGLTLAASLAEGQVLNSGAQAINLTANLNESMTLSLSSNSVSFSLTAGSGTNPGSASISATTTWVLKPGRTAVGVYAYFASSAVALTDNATPTADNIPSSAFFISNNGGALNALTATTPFGGANAGLLLSNTGITGVNKNSTRTDTMSFNIDLSSQTQLPAGTYTGVLTIQAQATP